MHSSEDLIEGASEQGESDMEEGEIDFEESGEWEEIEEESLENSDEQAPQLIPIQRGRENEKAPKKRSKSVPITKNF